MAEKMMSTYVDIGPSWVNRYKAKRIIKNKREKTIS